MEDQKEYPISNSKIDICITLFFFLGQGKGGKGGISIHCARIRRPCSSSSSSYGGWTSGTGCYERLWPPVRITGGLGLKRGSSMSE